jgi:hypothetical protein
MLIVVDADDFFEECNHLDLLFRMRAKIPEFKITLFTILGLCTPAFLDLLAPLDWIQLACHTRFHNPVPGMVQKDFEEEIKEWDSLSLLYPNMVKGFKAPGWQMTTWAYEVLKERNFWVADIWPPHESNKGRPEMKTFRMPMTATGRALVHFHVWDVCGNGLAAIFSPGHAVIGNHSVPVQKFKPMEELDKKMRFNLLFDNVKFAFVNDLAKTEPATMDLLKGSE